MIQLFRYLAVAFISIRSHKLRAFLTLLGIIIGVTSLVLTIGLGRGAAQSVSQDIAKEGVNLLSVSAGFDVQSVLTMADVEALANPMLIPEITAVVPEASDGLMRLVRDNVSIESDVIGTTAVYAAVHNLALLRGRFFTQAEVESQQRVVVLSTTIAQALFATTNPLGQTIRIQREILQVVGVLQESSSGFDFSDDKKVYIPLTVAQKRLFSDQRYRGEYPVVTINVQVPSQAQLQTVERKIERTLRLLHHLGAKDENDFVIMNQARLLALANSVSATLTILLGSIGAVSLLVGGIGIMNIMLVSVTERTREIGLRKALGAQDADILYQFLIEALTLTTLGGASGAALSYGIGFLIKQVPDMPFQVVIEVNVLLLALGVSLLCGFVFGLYPAVRATRLDPIEALRYE